MTETAQWVALQSDIIATSIIVAILIMIGFAVIGAMSMYDDIVDYRVAKRDSEFYYYQLNMFARAEDERNNKPRRLRKCGSK